MSSHSDLLGELESAARDVFGRVAGAGSSTLRDFKRLLSEVERRGDRQELDAEVITAVPLTPAETQMLEERLRDRYGPELPISYHVDTAILGGVVVRVGDRMVDGSLVSRLAQLRASLVGSRSGTG